MEGLTLIERDQNRMYTNSVICGKGVQEKFHFFHYVVREVFIIFMLRKKHYSLMKICIFSKKIEAY